MSAPTAPPPAALTLPPAHRRATLWAAAWWTLLTAVAYHWHAPALPPQLLRMGAATGERLAAEPWRLLTAPLLTEGALQLLMVVFGLLVAQPLEALWGTSAWLLVLLGGSVLGHAAAAVLPTQISVGPVAGLVALLVATARLRPERLRTDARSVRNLRRAALGLLGLHLPLLVVWPAVSPVGVALGLVLGWFAAGVADWPRLLRRVVAVALLTAALGALGLSWRRFAPSQLDDGLLLPSFQAAPNWQWVGPWALRVDSRPATAGKGGLLLGDPQLDVLVASVVPAPADVTAVSAPEIRKGALQTSHLAIVAGCDGRLWRVHASVLGAAPAPWHDAAAALVASVRPVCQ